MSRIYLSPPEIRASDRTAMESAFDSGWIAPVGPDLDAFEAAVAQRVGRTHACAVHSGTAALHLALLSREGKRYNYLPKLNFCWCAFPIRYCGAEPILLIVNWILGIWILNCSSCHRRVALRGSVVKAVIVVQIYGNVLKWIQL